MIIVDHGNVLLNCFLRSGQDDNSAAWNPSKICVLRDLDLWPDCATESDNDENSYGFKRPKDGNFRYWRKNCPDQQKRRTELIDGLNRQNIHIEISDDWTFEYCLAKYGLFDECYEAINGTQEGKEKITGTEDEKATYILSKVSKTDFAYALTEILRNQLNQQISDTLTKNKIGDIRENTDAYENAIAQAKLTYANQLKSKLPPYIVRAIAHVTSQI